MYTQAFTGCPARSGSSPAVTSRCIASCSASWYRWAYVRVSSAPAGADSASSTAVTTEAHSGVRSPCQHPGALEGGLQLDRPVLERLIPLLAGVVGQGAGVDLAGQPGQVPQVRACLGGGEQDRIRGLAAVFGELVGPQADRPGERLRDLPSGQRLRDLGMGGGAAGPGGVGDGGALGDAGAVDQPGPRAVVRVSGVSLPGGERGQDGGAGGGAHGSRLFEDLQALRLGLSGHCGGVRGGQEPQSRAHGLGCLPGAGERGRGGHRGCHLLPGARGPVVRCCSWSW